MFDEGRLTIRVVRLHNAPHDAPHDGFHNSFKEHCLLRNNDVSHSCHIWCQRTAAATTHFPILFATHQQVINKVMIEHMSNEILTFCIHAGYDISIAADLRFHYLIAKCQYFVILVAFDSVVLRIATPAGNPVAWALLEIPLPGFCRKSHCLGPAGNPIAWALQEIQLPGPCKKSHCLGPAENPIAWVLHEISVPRACTKSHCLGLAGVMQK